MILTKEVFSALNACTEGYETAIKTGNVGKDYDEVIAYCFANGLEPFGNWLTEQKKTEYYVRNNGSKFTMGAYQVFNPLTGQHTECADEATAKALKEIEDMLQHIQHGGRLGSINKEIETTFKNSKNG